MQDDEVAEQQVQEEQVQEEQEQVQVQVQVTVNGVPSDVPAATSVAALVAAHSEEQRRVAVALNGDVVPRSRWATTGVAAGDRVEVLAPTAGG